MASFRVRRASWREEGAGGSRDRKATSELRPASDRCGRVVRAPGTDSSTFVGRRSSSSQLGDKSNSREQESKSGETDRLNSGLSTRRLDGQNRVVRAPRRYQQSTNVVTA